MIDGIIRNFTSMKNVIFKLYVIKNNSEYEDVAFKSDLLNLNYKFGSAYYLQHKEMKSYLRFEENQEHALNKRIVLKHLLSLMLCQLKLIRRDHDLYFPIDMDEDFTSVLKCSLDADEQFTLQFGVLDAEGTGINIKTFEPIGEVSKNFTPQTQEVSCEKEELELSIAENILLLNTEAAEISVAKSN